MALSFCAGSPGWYAPVMLATALPLAVATSPGLRHEAVFAPWIVTTIPVTLGLWGVAAGIGPPWPLAISVVGAILFLRARSNSRSFLVSLLGLVAIVAYFSSGRGGAGPMIDWAIRFGLTEEQAHALTIAFRKTVHFCFYGSLGWIAMRAALKAGDEQMSAIRCGLLVVLTVATFDELRQSGYANRSGSAWDVLLDLTGATIFVGLSVWRGSRKR